MRINAYPGYPAYKLSVRNHASAGQKFMEGFYLKLVNVII